MVITGERTKRGSNRIIACWQRDGLSYAAYKRALRQPCSVPCRTYLSLLHATSADLSLAGTRSNTERTLTHLRRRLLGIRLTQPSLHDQQASQQHPTGRRYAVGRHLVRAKPPTGSPGDTWIRPRRCHREAAASPDAKKGWDAHRRQRATSSLLGAFGAWPRKLTRVGTEPPPTTDTSFA
jgi:hypothetical protein